MDCNLAHNEGEIPEAVQSGVCDRGRIATVAPVSVVRNGGDPSMETDRLRRQKGCQPECGQQDQLHPLKVALADVILPAGAGYAGRIRPAAHRAVGSVGKRRLVNNRRLNSKGEKTSGLTPKQIIWQLSRWEARLVYIGRWRVSARLGGAVSVRLTSAACRTGRSSPCRLSCP